MTSYLKSTGGKGLHIVIPIEPENEWPVIKQFAHSVALAMERENPNLYISKMTKAERTNRIYIDYLRNDRESTAIAPFSPRARSGAAVAITLDWKELEGKERPVFHVSDFYREFTLWCHSASSYVDADGTLNAELEVKLQKTSDLESNCVIC